MNWRRLCFNEFAPISLCDIFKICASETKRRISDKLCNFLSVRLFSTGFYTFGEMLPKIVPDLMLITNNGLDTKLNQETQWRKERTRTSAAGAEPDSLAKTPSPIPFPLWDQLMMVRHWPVPFHPPNPVCLLWWRMEKYTKSKKDPLAPSLNWFDSFSLFYSFCGPLTRKRIKGRRTGILGYNGKCFHDSGIEYRKQLLLRWDLRIPVSGIGSESSPDLLH